MFCLSVSRPWKAIQDKEIDVRQKVFSSVARNFFCRKAKKAYEPSHFPPYDMHDDTCASIPSREPILVGSVT